MKKTITALAMIALLGACGGGDSGDDEEEGGSPSVSPTTIEGEYTYLDHTCTETVFAPEINLVDTGEILDNGFRVYEVTDWPGFGMTELQANDNGDVVFCILEDPNTGECGLVCEGTANGTTINATCPDGLSGNLCAVLYGR